MKSTKRMMKTISLLSLILVMTACGTTSLTYDQAVDANEKAFEKSDKGSDAQFLVEMKSFSILEEQLGKLAMERSDDSLREYGESIYHERTSMNRQINDMAAERNTTVPEVMSMGHKMKYDRVKALKGDQFKRTFLATISEIYVSHINMLKLLTNAAVDEEIKEFVRTKLQDLQSDYQEVQKLQTELL